MADLALPIATKASRLAIMARVSRPWCAKAFFALLDQGLISGSNFALGILLARWLGAEEYGAYALAFAVFILLSLVYQSLLLEPMSVYGPSVYRDKLRGYTGTLIWIHIVIALATFLTMGAGALALAHSVHFGSLTSALIGAAIAAPCVLLFWLARRVYYLKLASSQAAVGAVLYSLLLFGTLALLRLQHTMSPMLAFVVMATAALVTSAYLLLRFRPQLSWKASDPDLKQVTHENWEYGRWALVSSIFMWVPWNIFYSLVASFSSMADSGQLRALLNFALPMAQTFGAFSLLFLPHAARLNEEKGWPAVQQNAYRIMALFIAGGLAYWTIVYLFHAQLVDLLYAGQYTGIEHLIPAIGIASLLWGAAQGPAIALRARKEPYSVFVMHFVSALVAIAVGIPATVRFGIDGAVLAILLASGAAWITGLIRIGKRSESVLHQVA